MCFSWRWHLKTSYIKLNSLWAADDESALLAVNAIIFTFKLLLVSNELLYLEINVFFCFSTLENDNFVPT